MESIKVKAKMRMLKYYLPLNQWARRNIYYESY